MRQMCSHMPTSIRIASMAFSMNCKERYFQGTNIYTWVPVAVYMIELCCILSVYNYWVFNVCTQNTITDCILFVHTIKHFSNIARLCCTFLSFIGHAYCGNAVITSVSFIGHAYCGNAVITFFH